MWAEHQIVTQATPSPNKLFSDISIVINPLSFSAFSTDGVSVPCFPYIKKKDIVIQIVIQLKTMDVGREIIDRHEFSMRKQDNEQQMLLRTKCCPFGQKRS